MSINCLLVKANLFTSYLSKFLGLVLSKNFDDINPNSLFLFTIIISTCPAWLPIFIFCCKNLLIFNVFISIPLHPACDTGNNVYSSKFFTTLHNIAKLKIASKDTLFSFLFSIFSTKIENVDESFIIIHIVI